MFPCQKWHPIMPLYHKALGFPKDFKPLPLFNLKYGPHAIDAAKFDNYGPISSLPKHFLPRIAEIIEIETDLNGELIKLVSRQVHDKELDLILVISIKDKFVKTVWRNMRSDKHLTLDKTKYNKPI